MIASILFRRRRMTLVACAALALALSLPVAASPQGPAWTSFKVKGQFATRSLRACGNSKKFRLFHAGSLVEARGFVTPPPATHFPAVIKVQKCVNGRFVTVAKYDVVGKKLTGKVKAFFKAPALPRRDRHHRGARIVFYRASGIFNGAESEQHYFAVVR
jgi:hypothetical protein